MTANRSIHNILESNDLQMFACFTDVKEHVLQSILLVLHNLRVQYSTTYFDLPMEVILYA